MGTKEGETPPQIKENDLECPKGGNHRLEFQGDMGSQTKWRCSKCGGIYMERMDIDAT